MEKYEKLVRDKIPEILDSKGVVYEQNIASEEEYRKRLFAKLAEEIDEFKATPNTEELSDVLEVIEAIKKLPGFEDIEAIKAKKLIERGGFSKRLILKGEK